MGKQVHTRNRTLVAIGVAGLRREWRQFELWWSRSLSLTQRLLAGAVIVVVLGMAALGFWTSETLKDGLLKGISSTAAASIDALIAWQLTDLGPERPLNPDDLERLGNIFAIGNEALSTRLLQIRLHDRSGEIIYDSGDGLVETEDRAPFIDAARAGVMTANLRELDVAPVGPVAAHRVSVLKVYAPIHVPGTADTLAVAELYFSAGALLALQAEAQRNVWILVAVIGAAIGGLLYLLVDRSSRLIRTQRERLAENLARSRRLARENLALHRSSEQLRLAATTSNENLLAQIGSDLHDGPLQLLTLIILRLTRDRGELPEGVDERAATVQLARDAISELRNISTGLVLPELAEMDLAGAISSAVSRHQELTGSKVALALSGVNFDTSDAMKVCAYRVVQEALNNAYRHGEHHGQKVAARLEDDALVLEIENRARASDAGAANDGRLPLGLKGMRFRVEALGGVLVADFGEADTSRVIATIPLRSSSDQDDPSFNRR